MRPDLGRVESALGWRVAALSGLALTGLLSLGYLFPPGVFHSLDLKIYDVLLRSRPGRPSEIPLVVDIDDASLSRLGQWPWPRNLIAGLLEKLKTAGAASIGLDIVFSEPDRTSPVQVQKDFDAGEIKGVDLDRVPLSVRDHDAGLAAVLGRGPYVLGYKFLFAPEVQIQSDVQLHPLNMIVLRATGAPEKNDPFVAAEAVHGNLPILARAVSRSGFINIVVDSDGVLRRTPLVIKRKGEYYPSLALAAWLQARGLRQAVLTASARGAESLKLGDLEVPLDGNGNLLIRFRGRAKTQTFVAAADVLSGRVPPEVVRGRIVFLGSSALGLREFQPTPFDEAVPGVEIHATIVDNFASGDFLSRPSWIPGIELLLVLAVGALSAPLFGRGGLGRSLLILAIGIVGLWEAARWTFISKGVYFSPFFPWLTLAAGFILLTLLRFWRGEQRARGQMTMIRQLATILESTGEPIIGRTIDGLIESWNRGAETLYGYKREEILGRPFALLSPPELRGERSEDLRRFIPGEFIAYQETVHLTKDGRRLRVFLSEAQARNERGKINGASMIVHDLTERKQVEEADRLAGVKIKNALGGIVQTAALIIEQRDSYTASHQRRVTELAEAIARSIGLPEETVEGIGRASAIHDIGKIAVPYQILSKAGPLSELETLIVKTHARAGFDILKGIEFPWPIARAILQHHEREDGSGYPQGLKSSEIIVEAKIIAVADAMEAMISHRPFRPALSLEAALQEMTRDRGKLYLPDAVDVCRRLLERDAFRFKTT